MVIGLFVGFAYLGVRTARRAPDAFGRLVAIGVTTWIVGQAIVNMGAVTGLLPITGVPLPLVSFGGSALVVSLVAIGILANIARQEQWPPPGTSKAKAQKPRRALRVATQRADRARATVPSLDGATVSTEHRDRGGWNGRARLSRHRAGRRAPARPAGCARHFRRDAARHREGRGPRRPGTRSR